MLSRVAERIYWMARYLERAENTARLLDVYHGLLLDLPADASIGWDPLLEILGCHEAFDAAHEESDAKSIQYFLAANPDNPASLVSSLSGARENARTTRDLLPAEAWRAVNELHLFAQKQLPRGSVRHRHDVLMQIVGRCQSIAGLLAGTMSQGPAYQLIRAGRNLERADMTTRLIDAAASILISGHMEPRRYDNTLWMAILRSLSAYQMYRQHVRRRVFGPNVIDYLLKDAEFPRAVGHCLTEAKRSLATLPRPGAALDSLALVLAQVSAVQADAADPEDIHHEIDQLQLSIGAVHDAIRATWFLPEEAVA